MTEYINRKSLMKRLCERCTEEMSESPCEPSGCFIREVIKTITAADVAPVRHGRWIQCNYMDKSAKCSECGGYYTRFTVNERYPEYCPYCGAKMDGDNDD